MKCPYCRGTGNVGGTADLPADVYHDDLYNGPACSTCGEPTAETPDGRVCRDGHRDASDGPRYCARTTWTRRETVALGLQPFDEPRAATAELEGLLQSIGLDGLEALQQAIRDDRIVVL